MGRSRDHENVLDFAATPSYTLAINAMTGTSTHTSNSPSESSGLVRPNATSMWNIAPEQTAEPHGQIAARL